MPSCTAVTTAFEAEPADDDAVADRRQRLAGLRIAAGGGGSRRLRRTARHDRVDRRPRVARAPRRRRRCVTAVPARRFCAIAVVFAFSSAITSSISRRACRTCVVELLGQPAAERLFALLERLFALAHPRLGGLERLALARRQPLLVLERAHVAIDLREVLGELRLARAEVLRAPRRSTDGFSPSRAGDLERQAAARRAVDQLIGRRERLGVEAERRARHALGRRRVGLERVVVARRDDASRRAAGSDRRSPRRARRLRSDRCPIRLRRAGRAPASTRPRSIDAMFVMCAENVLRLASIDCSSPMSAKIDRNTGSRDPSAAGNAQAGLRHQREQSRGLERDGLAAGVRSGDEQHRRRRHDLDRDRHRRA